ncbi:ATP-dependent DNA helicase PIF1-like [Coffea eugenioides]|uniref:ATP-dependent DNA helicase PIF1-like n=1 Tax=Coffea eugenioides TaxID=49369 RepID=UPI000F606F93|nr:ATP-dependent DNA helicase PIF1-like [Coffea eugenioides]
MRANVEISGHIWPNFTEYLLRIGNGTKPVVKDENVEIPSKMLIRYSTEEESLAALINTVYPDFSIFASSNYSGINRSILTTKNDFVDEINDSLIQQFPGASFDYISRDACLDPSQQAILEDFINSLTPNGLPPHQLTLKQNTPIMLLRNIDPPEGLCNGTRLVCRSLKPNVIDAVISSGEYSGKQVFLHRICFRIEDDPNCPISIERIQFPVRLCFAMTINKAQGQTLDFVGIYLREPVFSHGQLYVAISSAKSSNSVKVLIRPPIHDTTLDNLTPNIVY